ncbi:hypothetical protein MMC25_006808 [Agyrium rufum]|nr:hypothetical protein [Agyrium rufum]
MPSTKPIPKGLEPGRRLLPVVVDHCAKRAPTRVWASVPRQENLAEGFRDLTYRDFANAINRAAWWLESVVGKGRGQFEAFAYTGPNDLRYPVLAMAAIKVGKTIVTTVSSQWSRLRSLYIPDFDQWFSDEEVQPYVYEKTWDEAKDEPALIFHTGGTTGLPRPIVYTNSMMTVFDAGNFYPDQDKFVYHHFANRRVYSPLPCIHVRQLLSIQMEVVGMFLALQLTVFWGMTLVTGPPTEKPVRADVADEVLQHGHVKGAIYPSSLIEESVRSRERFGRIQKLRFIAFAGAPLSRPTGQLISESINLVPIIGSTEVGLFTSFITERNNWNYYKFAPQNGFDLENHSGQLYELVVRKRPDLARWQQIFYIYPELDEFHTKDLFSRHPTEPDTWSFAGRTDDVIFLTIGRLYVKDMETAIRKHPLVACALIGGERRKRPFLLIELRPEGNAYPAREVIDAIWPSVQAANNLIPDPLFRLSKELILLTHPFKPLSMVENGSVARRESIALYEREIQNLYAEHSGASGELGQIKKKMSGATSKIKRALTSGSDAGKHQRSTSSNSVGDRSATTSPNRSDGSAFSEAGSRSNSRPGTPGAGLGVDAPVRRAHIGGIGGTGMDMHPLTNLTPMPHINGASTLPYRSNGATVHGGGGVSTVSSTAVTPLNGTSAGTTPFQPGGIDGDYFAGSRRPVPADGSQNGVATRASTGTSMQIPMPMPMPMPGGMMPPSRTDGVVLKNSWT